MARRARRVSRNTILFVLGVLGVAHETVVNSPTERPFLLALYGAWTGLPIWLSYDERRRDGGVDRDGA